MGAPEIQSYAFGSMRVRGKEYSADLIIFPDGVRENWWRRKGHRLSVEDLRDVFEYRPGIDALVIGCGQAGRMKIPPEVEREITSRGIKLYSAATAEAGEKYNALIGSNRVAGAFHLTC